MLGQIVATVTSDDGDEHGNTGDEDYQAEDDAGCHDGVPGGPHVVSDEPA